MVIPPIKTWMKAPINSDEYLDGVESFIVFTHTSLGKDTRCSCPCVNCCNIHGMVDLGTVFDHLIRYGIDQTYTTWYFHGESFEENVSKSGLHGTFHDNQFEPTQDFFENLTVVMFA
ncbi:hypothetical protein ACHQM5_004740 [Ranunculus cassubicifolius]